MYQRRRARVVLAVLVLIALVLITIDFRSSDEGPLSRLRSLATATFGPVQDGLSSLLRPVGNAIDDIGDVFSLRAENEQLRTRLTELEERRRSFDDLERENETLRALLSMRDRTGFDVVAARVVALAPSNYEWTITIDAGSEDGVERDMVVIDGDGLVGRIIQVTPSASRVLLAIDPNFSAAARVAGLGEQGPMSGRGGDLMRFLPLDPEAEIERGDEIVTSSYSNGIFPSGIPIGSVEDVGEQTTLLSREVDVRPYVDFTRLDFVLVVLHAPIPELPQVTRDTGDLPFIPPRPSPSPSPDPQASPTPEPQG